MDTLRSSRRAGVRGQGVVNLANRTRVVLAGLDIPLQQLDHDGLGQVAGGASLSRRRRVVECLHVVLVEAERVRIENKRCECQVIQICPSTEKMWWCQFRGNQLYLFLCALEAAAIPLEVSKGLLHQTVQIHLVAELQLRVSLQHDGHHHQQLHKQPRALKDNQKLQKAKQQSRPILKQTGSLKRTTCDTQLAWFRRTWLEICDCCQNNRAQSMQYWAEIHTHLSWFKLASCILSRHCLCTSALQEEKGGLPFFSFFFTSTIICRYSGRSMFFSVSSTSREKFISYMVMSDSVGCCTERGGNHLTFTRDKTFSLTCHTELCLQLFTFYT